MCISLDRIYNVCGVPFKMIFVKGGSCILGSSEIDDVIPNYNPIHSAEIEDFYIGETLITRELASKLCVEVDGPFKRFFKEVDDTPQLPVNLFFGDCLRLIFNLNQLTGESFRFPTADEWEYAARGGRNSKGYIYAGSNNIDEVAWIDSNSGRRRNPVKLKKPNELGIYDMSGNMVEYCACNPISKYIRGSDDNWSYSLPHVTYRGGCSLSSDNECEVSCLCDWAYDLDEWMGMRLCLSANQISSSSI